MNPTSEKVTAKQSPKGTHTPTPWIMKAGVGLGTEPYFVGETMDSKDTPFQALKEANAAFIVRAVNAHDALVENLKEEHRLVCDDAIGGWEGYHSHLAAPCSSCEALAKATGGV